MAVTTIPNNAIGKDEDRSEKSILNHNLLANRFWQLKSLAEMASAAMQEGKDTELDNIVLTTALDGIAELANRYALDHFNAS